MNDQAKKLETRPPIVVVMGHVDHGKTTLLDAIRQTRIAQKEEGGITQNMGAYEVTRTYADHTQIDADKNPSTPLGAGADQREQKITFIDTPGHEAFFAMRSHGVKIADVALLVVAADDGVKPQTEEAIQHIQEAKIPYILVINKIDKPGAAVDRVKKELSDKGVLIEEWGGKVPVALVSALQKQGMAELLDLILLIAEMEELKYDPAKQGEGYVIESNLDSRRGLTATVVTVDGNLKLGDIIVCGSSFGSIKIMEDDQGRALAQAFPSKPILIVGLNELPMVGEKCLVVDSMESAGKIASEHKQRHIDFLKTFQLEPAGQPKVMPIVIKAAEQGSLEALINVLKAIKSDKVGLKLIKAEIGDISQSDVKQAEAASARIAGFRVNINKDAVNYAAQRGVIIKTFDVIYNFVECVRELMTEQLDAEIIKNEIGRLEILAIFRAEKSRMIIGGKIFSGKFKKGLKVEIFRNNVSLGLGKVVNLQKEKEAQDEIYQGNEAGLLLESNVAVKVGDILVGFEEEKKYPEL